MEYSKNKRRWKKEKIRLPKNEIKTVCNVLNVAFIYRMRRV